MSNAQERIWVYIAHLETRNFNFQSIGHTEEEAIKVMRLALEAHGKQYHCAPQWWKEFGEVAITRLAYGIATRDGDIIADLDGRLEGRDTLITFSEVA